jgi:hypothetical protein
MTLDGCRFDNNTARVVSADSRNATSAAGGGAVYLASSNVGRAGEMPIEGNNCLNNWGWEQGAAAYGGAIGSIGKMTFRARDSPQPASLELPSEHGITGTGAI